MIYGVEAAREEDDITPRKEHNAQSESKLPEPDGNERRSDVSLDAAGKPTTGDQVYFRFLSPPKRRRRRRRRRRTTEAGWLGWLSAFTVPEGLHRPGLSFCECWQREQKFLTLSGAGQ